MSNVRSILEAKDQLIRRQTYGIGGLVGACVFLWWGWKSAPADLTVHLPPDLRNGAAVTPGEVPPPGVYAFAYYIFQQLNRWPKNGDADYKERIEALQHYLTPACYDDRLSDYAKRRQASELINRVRGLQEIPGRGYAQDRVQLESADSWVVFLDLQVQESFHGQPVKDTFVRFPLRVVRYAVDYELNPFQLALDCYADEPKRLALEPTQVAQP